MKEYSRSPLTRGLDEVSQTVAGKLEGSILDELVGRRFEDLDPKIRDWIAVRSSEFYFQFGRGHGLPSSEARRAFRLYMQHWYEGKRSLFSEWAPSILRDFKMKVVSADVPKEAGIYVVNHPTGPLCGAWYSFVFNNTVVNRGNGFEPRWLHKEYSENPLLSKVSLLRSVRERQAQLSSTSMNTILFNQSMHKALSEARNYIKEGGVVAFSCQSEESDSLGQIHGGVGRLVAAIRHKDDFPIYPVGVWQDGRDLNIKFGMPVAFGNFHSRGEDNSGDKQNGGQISDQLGTEIAKLLPPERRGFYFNNIR